MYPIIAPRGRRSKTRANPGATAKAYRRERASSQIGVGEN